MPKRLLLPLVAALLLAANTPSRAENAGPRPLVVVELFTSQGCSSCPPADAYLGQLAKRAGLLALGFHIDYWNYIGWDDPFSLKIAAARQRAYSRKLGPGYVFTPEMVIDGRREGIGSEPTQIEALIKAGRHDAPGPQLTLARRANGSFHIHVGPGKDPRRAILWLVGLDREHKTQVARGENAGRTAIDYQVVRSMKAVGHWDGAAVDLDLPPGEAQGEDAALLLQAGGIGPILAATKAAGPTS